MSTRGASEQGESQRQQRGPVYLAILGVAATLVLVLIVVFILLLNGYPVSENAAVIGGLIALGGVFTTQLVNTALEKQRVQETRRLEDLRAQETRRLEDLRAQETRRLEGERTQRALELEEERARAASL